MCSARIPLAQSAQRALLAALILLTVAASGCGESASSAPIGEPAPSTEAQRQEIVESDIYKREGDLLYLFNAETGLNIVDLSQPRYPRRLGGLPRETLATRAGELYVRSEPTGEGRLSPRSAIVLGRALTSGCINSAGVTTAGIATPGWRADTTIAVVDVAQPQRPTLASRVCLPGLLVASRLVGGTLIVVTRGPTLGRDGSSAHAYSLDLSDPERPFVIADVALRGVSKEIHLTDERLFIASRADDCAYDCRGTSQTRIDVLTLSAVDGKLTRRGALTVRGEPQGRFHMDARGDHFRIVTFDPTRRDSVLHVLDFADPDRPAHVAELGGLGRGERLFATRFDGDRAYVVTFRQTDPLWIVDLRQPTHPRVVGELIVPGWSDFIFPRGDQLLAVGRTGLRGALQVSLFDVSDPSSPRALSQLHVGDVTGTSAATLDHRAVTILERGDDDPTRPPLVVVPFGVDPNTAGCSAQHLIQLIDLQPYRLVARGVAEHTGVVQRTFAAGGVLLGISDHEVRSFDLRDRDWPVAEGLAIVGTRAALTCTAEYAPPPAETTTFVQTLDRVEDDGRRRLLFCSAPEGEASLLSVGLLLALVGLVARTRRRRNEY